MCGGSPKMPEVPKAAPPPPVIPTYTPVKDPTEAQSAKREDNKAKLAAMYGMSRTIRTSGMGVPNKAGTARATAIGSVSSLGGGA